MAGRKYTKTQGRICYFTVCPFKAQGLLLILAVNIIVETICCYDTIAGWGPHALIGIYSHTYDGCGVLSLVGEALCMSVDNSPIV